MAIDVYQKIKINDQIFNGGALIHEPGRFDLERVYREPPSGVNNIDHVFNRYRGRFDDLPYYTVPVSGAP